ncbi:hypothetical protein ACPYO6_07190 [Georgenia sp. Z1344]|uniref:hypothetical protein n=1 Tax=Georgenia sp. Z1344 TaxID=3416706 RepID=UPI003CF4AF3B
MVRDLALTAKYGMVEEFYERLKVEPVDTVSATGLPAIVAAASSSKSSAGRAMISALLDAGADASATTVPEGRNVLHALFDRPPVDGTPVAALVPRLVAAGADINLRDSSGWRPVARLVRSSASDVELEPVLDAVLALDGLVLDEPATSSDQTLLDYARAKVHRAGFARRLEEYAAAR